MQIKSGSFQVEETIPVNYTCEGNDISPELSWIDAPENTKSFALIVDDPDAPNKTWVHWVVYNIPANMKGFPEGISEKELKDKGIKQGINDFEQESYGGPCPPHGHGQHRYYFKLYALDTVLDLKEGASKADLEKAIEEHILAQAEVMGRFERE